MTPTPQVLPSEEFNALQSGLRSFKSVDAATAALLLSAAQGHTTGHNAQVFTMGVLDVLPGGGGLSAAKVGGWQLAGEFGGQIVACEMYTGARGGPQPLPQGSPRLSCVRTGEPGNRLLRAIASLQEIDGQPPATPFV